MATELEKQLAEALEMALEWIDAVPKHIQLPVMPGFDRDEVNNTLAAYRAQQAAPSGQPAQGEREANGRGIYVASRASAPERPAMWRALRDAGWPIVSSWIDEAGEGETTSFTELWARIESEIRGSSGVILYAETEDFPLKGAYIEAGIALGAGLPVAVVLPGVPLKQRSDRPIGSWIRHPRVTICGSLEEARAALASQPAAMVTLTEQQIVHAWAVAQGTRYGYAPFARAAIAEFCRVNGITAPAAQEVK